MVDQVLCDTRHAPEAAYDGTEVLKIWNFKGGISVPTPWDFSQDLGILARTSGPWDLKSNLGISPGAFVPPQIV